MGFSLTVDDKSGIFVNIGIIIFFFSLFWIAKSLIH